MKNLVLRANILDENVNIEHKVLSLPLSNNMIDVMVSPKTGYILEPEDLSHGALPIQISSIDFIKSGPNVIARVLISSVINNNVSQNISLPLISNSKLNIDSFSLVDMTIEDMSRITTINTSPYLKTIKPIGESYHITCAPGETKLVLSKTITAVGNYYFNSGPNYQITGNSDRYSVREDIVRDNMNRVVSKKLNIYYTSPLGISETDNEDHIQFNFITNNKTYTRQVKPATVKEEFEIYSFDEGRKIGAEGGTKIMRVRGVPGTEFKIIVQDNNKKTYNFTTGLFENGGGMFFGTLPPAMEGKGYGESLVFVKIPKTTSAASYKTTFTTDKPIDHDAIQEAVKSTMNPTYAGEQATRDVSIAKTIDPPEEVEVETYSVMNWEIGNGGTFTISELTWDPLPYDSVTKEQMNDKIFTGKGKVGTSTNNITFSCYISSSNTDYPLILPVTQPVSAAAGTYLNQDQTGFEQIGARTNAAGTTITNDWSMTDAEVESEADFSVSAKVIGYGEANSDATADGDTYYSVLLKGTISNIKFGKSDITAKLDLLNFLKLYAV